MAEIYRKAVPIPAAASGAYVDNLYGKTYRAADGVIDSYNMGALGVLGTAGWTILPPHGTTAERPTNAANGQPFIDDTLGKTIYAQVWPSGSSQVVGWCDQDGNAV